MVLGNCGTCIFFNKLTPGPGIPPGAGVCRRFPPLPIVTITPANPLDPRGMPGQGIASQFPPMDPSGWCGECMTHEQYAEETGESVERAQAGDISTLPAMAASPIARAIADAKKS